MEGCGRETWNLLEGKVEKHYARVVKRFKQEHDGDGLAWRARKVKFWVSREGEGVFLVRILEKQIQDGFLGEHN